MYFLLDFSSQPQIGATYIPDRNAVRGSTIEVMIIIIIKKPRGCLLVVSRFHLRPSWLPSSTDPMLRHATGVFCLLVSRGFYVECHVSYAARLLRSFAAHLRSKLLLCSVLNLVLYVRRVTDHLLHAVVVVGLCIFCSLHAQQQHSAV